MTMLLYTGCGKGSGKISDPQIARYVTAKRQQAREMADAGTNPVPSVLWKYFDAVERDKFKTATNRFNEMRRIVFPTHEEWESKRASARRWESVLKLFGQKPPPAAPPNALETELWYVIREVKGIYEMTKTWDDKLLRRYAHDIISSIPTNSIYLASSEPGYFAVAAFSESHREGRPFFTLDQSHFAGGLYLSYLETAFGGRVQSPTFDDRDRAHRNYLNEVRKWTENGSPYEDQELKAIDDRLPLPRHFAIGDISGELVRVIMEKNPDREIYMEQDLPIKWAYPHLEPHGLILKLNREPLPRLSEEVVAKDRQYWTRYTRELAGDLVSDETPIKDMCGVLQNAAVLPSAVRNREMSKVYARMRSNIGGVYVWRAEHASSADEKGWMLREAEFAYKQALAIGPTSIDAATRYVTLLLRQQRQDEARMVASLFQKLEPRNIESTGLVLRVDMYKKP